VARLIYWQVPAPLPTDMLAGLWTYYKTYSNTSAGSTMSSSRR
jgi:hypothetical protein